MKGNGAWIDVRATCPYCDYATSVLARDIRGQRFVLECLDCHETYVVEVACQVTHRTRGLADVDKNEVLDRLARKKTGAGTGAPGPSPKAALAARGDAAAVGGNRSPPLKTRRVQGHRYGPDAPGD